MHTHAHTHTHTHTHTQSSVLRKAALSDQDVWWWIKGDGVHVVKGLGESVGGEWCGDVDLNDGILNQLFQDYRRLLEEASQIGLGERKHSANIATDLTAAAERVEGYLTFIHDGK